MKPEIGIHYGVPFADYLQWEAVNQSTLKHMLSSPQHYRYAVLESVEVTEAMLQGTAIHTAVLEPDMFSACYERWEKVKGKGEAAFAKDQAASTKTLYSSEWNVPEIASAIRSDPATAALIAEVGNKVSAEVCIVWDEPNGIRCKARLDGLSDKFVFDLKSIGKVATDHECTSAAFKLGYHFQAAFGLRGLKALGHSAADWALVFVEKSAPFAVNTFWIDGDTRDVGASQVGRCLNRLRQCLDSGQWPGPAAVGIKPMQCPKWALIEEGLA